MDENRVLSLNLFLNMMKESCDNEKRYCFILGAGASKSSGIPTGEEMAQLWHDELVANTPPGGTARSKTAAESSQYYPIQ